MARKLSEFEREQAKMIRQMKADEKRRAYNRDYQKRYRREIAEAKEAVKDQAKIERQLKARLGSNNFSTVVNKHGRAAVDATLKANLELAKIRKAKADKSLARRLKKLPPELQKETFRLQRQGRAKVKEIPDQIGAVYRKGKKTGWYERRDSAGNVVKKYHGIKAARKARNMIQHASSVKAVRKALPFISYREAAKLLKVTRSEAKKITRQILNSKEFKKLTKRQKERVKNYLKKRPRAAVRAFLAEHDIHDTF